MAVGDVTNSGWIEKDSDADINYFVTANVSSVDDKVLVIDEGGRIKLIHIAGA